MREIKTIECDKYVPAGDGIHLKHVGMITAQQAFDQLEKHLKEVDMLPDEYFQLFPLQKRDEELPNFRSAVCHTNWGGNEGIYIDLSLMCYENNEPKLVPFATGKTLCESGDAFMRMSRIAAECSMMLNGRGEIVKVPDRYYETEKTVEAAPVNHLHKFIEQEIPFRLKEIHDIDADQDAIDVLVERLQDDNDVMFDYDGLDDWILKQYDEIVRESKDFEGPSVGNHCIPDKTVEHGAADPVSAYLEESLKHLREANHMDLSDEDLVRLVDELKNSPNEFIDTNSLYEWLLDRCDSLAAEKQQTQDVSFNDLISDAQERAGVPTAKPAIEHDHTH